MGLFKKKQVKDTVLMDSIIQKFDNIPKTKESLGIYVIIFEILKNSNFSKSNKSVMFNLQHVDKYILEKLDESLNKILDSKMNFDDFENKRTNDINMMMEQFTNNDFSIKKELKSYIDNNNKSYSTIIEKIDDACSETSIRDIEAFTDSNSDTPSDSETESEASENLMEVEIDSETSDKEQESYDDEDLFGDEED